jgi:hypothetical protein
MQQETSACLKALFACCPKLEKRLAEGIPTTEDTIRYYFFLELMSAGLSPDHMILERPHPHPQLRGKEIDLSTLGGGDRWDLDVRYHRRTPGGRNLPLTQLRGSIVADLYKLALSDAPVCHLLYVAEEPAAAHMQSRLSWLLDAQPSAPLHIDAAWLKTQPATLRETVPARLGFAPSDVSFDAWTSGEWQGEAMSCWLFTVETGDRRRLPETWSL